MSASRAGFCPRRTGCIPLVIASGPGSGSQNAIGTAVVGGMFAGTVLAVFFVPVFDIVVRSLGDRLKRKPATHAPAPEVA